MTATPAKGLRKECAMKTTYAAAGLVLAMIASPAMAQSNTAPGGLHVSVIAGYEGLGVESDSGTVSADADSAVYGVTAGYDLSLGSAFVGVEGEYSASTGSTEFPSNFAGARGGLALTPGIAAYGKVGYTALDTRSFTSAGNFSDLEENATGLRFGGGVQVALPGPLEARLEYRRSRYEDIGGDVGEATTDQLVAGVGIRF